MRVDCECTHAKTRHRQEFGDPHSGSCKDCGCQRMRPVLVPKQPVGASR